MVSRIQQARGEIFAKAKKRKEEEQSTSITPAPEQTQAIQSAAGKAIETSKKIQEAKPEEPVQIQIIRNRLTGEPSYQVTIAEAGKARDTSIFSPAEFYEFQNVRAGRYQTNNSRVNNAVRKVNAAIAMEKVEAGIRQEDLSAITIPTAAPPTSTEGIGTALTDVGAKTLAGVASGAAAGAISGAAVGGVGAIPGAIGGAIVGGIGTFGYSLYKALTKTKTNNVDSAVNRFDTAFTYYEQVDKELAEGKISYTQAQVNKAFYASEMYRARSELKQQINTTWLGSRSDAIAKMDEINIQIQATGL